MRAIVLSGTSDASVLEDITELVSDIDFSTSVPGLYDKSSLSISDRESGVFIRFLGYLGKRVIILTNDLDIVWDGLIWSVDANFGGSSIGPRDLGTVQNYVRVEYSDILNSGKYALTSALSDANSQSLYGIKEQILPYGGMTSSAADKAVQRYLNNHLDPFTSGSLSIPISGNQIQVKLSCVGWWATTHYRKFQSTITTTTTVQNRISEIVNRTVLPDNPAGSYYLEFFSTETGMVEGTDLVIARATPHVETVGSYLHRVVSLGDNSYGTWYIGAEHGEYSGSGLDALGAPRMKVWQRPTAPQFFISTREGKIFNNNGGVVHPAKIQAGHYVQFIDVAPVQLGVAGWLDRIRGFVLEETSYNASTGVLTGKPEGQDLDVDVILSRMI